MSGTISRARAIGDVSRAALVRGDAPVAGAQPMFETNLVETLGIRKFLVFAEEDLRLQVEAAARTTRSRREFDEVKAGAQVIAAWIAGNLALVDQMLQSGQKKEDARAAD